MSQTLEQIFSKLGVTQDFIEQAQQRQTTQGGSIRKQLIDLNVFTEESFARKVTEYLRVPYVNLEKLTVPDDLLALLPREQAEKYIALPLKLDERHRRLTMSMADPLDMAAINELQFVVGYTLIPHYTPEDELSEAIQREYARFEAKQAAAVALGARFGETEIQKRTIDVASLSTAEIVTLPLIEAILTVAYARQASEIHLETDFEQLRVRFRIDGKMADIAHFPKQLASSLISRLKRLLGVETEEHLRWSQKGCAVLKFSDQKVCDLSYQIYLADQNEQICMKLKERSKLLALDDFELEPEAEKTLKRFLGASHGMVLVSGKARSGLTTTLYALVNAVNQPHINILSIENPVECTLEGVTQGQVNVAAGYTYEHYLRHALTQRPEMIMVDRIWGAKMAQDVLSLASGTLVLSSLAAEDAASATIKLVLMTNPQLVVDHVNCITCQRLVKKICEACKEEVVLADTHREKLGFAPEDRCYTGKGCEQCGYTGYTGLTPIFEIMSFPDDVKQAIIGSCTADDLRALNARYSMASLRDDGMRKVKQGLTTVQEVLKATMI